jgi:hypothetical protein
MTKREQTQLAVLETKLDTVCEQVGDLHHTVVGNGKPGLVIRVDRLEQARSLRDKLLWLLTTTAASLIGAYILHWLTK